MSSLRPAYLATLALPPRVAGMLRRLGEHKGRQELYRRQAPEMLENLRRVARIESTESSNRLEGIVADSDQRLRALYYHGFEVGRYISLERIIEKTKESYYDTLLLSSQGWHDGKHDVWPWTEYFLGTLLAAYSEFEDRFGRISSGRGSKTDTVKNAISAFMGDFTIQDLEKACPMVSRDMIRRILADLKKAGSLECLNRGRWAKWRNKGNEAG